MPDPNQTDQNNQTPTTPPSDTPVVPVWHDEASNINTPEVNNEPKPELSTPPTIPNVEPVSNPSAVPIPQSEVTPPAPADFFPSEDTMSMPLASDVENPEGKNEPAAGSNAPSFDGAVNPMVDTPPKKKFGGGKVIATILGLLVLVGGLGAGVILVQQQQDIRQKASQTCSCHKTTDPILSSGICYASNSSAVGSCNGTSCSCPTFCYVPDSNQCTPFNPTTATSTQATITSTTATTTTTTTSCASTGQDCVRGCCTGLTCQSGRCLPISTTTTATPTPYCSGTMETSCRNANKVCVPSTTGGSCGATITATVTAGTCSSGDTRCKINDECHTLQVCSGGIWYDYGCPSNKGCGFGGAGPSGKCGVNAYCCHEDFACSGATATATTTAPTATGTDTPDQLNQCLNIKIYDTNWVELSGDAFFKLKAGDKVRFTVAGTTTGSTTITGAKFKINGVETAEITEKKPSSSEFFTEYTIPATTYHFTINAQLHLSTGEWF